MEQEKDVKEDGNEEKNEGKGPDDKSKGHARQDGGLAIVFLGQNLDLVKEAEKRAIDRSGFGGELGFVDGLEGKGVDDLARPRADQDADPGWGMLANSRAWKE